MPPVPEPPETIAFGHFLLSRRRRELLADGQPVKLGGRAFDVLLALVDASGSVVSKDELLDRVWPGRIVEESVLQVQISSLRTALGADRGLIRTVSGRGYQFTAEIRNTSAGQGERTVPDVPAQTASPIPTNLPEPVSRLIGRDKELHEVANLAAAHRLVTLTGPGGIGKTRLALAAAREMLPRFPDGVWLAELSPLTDAALVPATVAAAAGVDIGAGGIAVQRLAQALAGRRMLLVLDTCEHVIAAAAEVAEAILHAGRGVSLLATSREPLEAEGEWVYPVPPLAIPEQDVAESELPHYGAVRLFVERARAANARFAADARALAGSAAICRQLDGIPLAIEMAAARTSTLAVGEIAARLDDRFRLLTGWRRTGLPRHQTLRAACDWSYELLTEPERMVLRRLAVFSGPFSAEAAGAVAASPPELTQWAVTDTLSSLIAKSLVTAEASSVRARLRLLDTTRAYAREKLEASGEYSRLARRHAAYYRVLFERAEAEWETRPAAEWTADYAPRIDNLRAALDWAFSPEGDQSIGVALTVAAVPLWMQLSLVDESRRCVEQAFGAAAAGVEVDARREMKLHAALGASLMYTGGGGPELATAWQKALQIAESLADARYQLLSLWGLWAYHVNGVDYHTALTLARKFHSLAASRPPENQLAGERMIAISHHFLGDQPSARRHIERALSDFTVPGGERHTIPLELDPRVTARVHLARILWLQGFPERAMRAAEQCVENARAARHAISFSYALHRGACPVALWMGDLSAAERYAEVLLDHATRHALGRWPLYGRGYQAAVAIKRGDTAAGLRLLRASFEEFGETGIVAPRFMRFAAVYMAEALGQAGQISDGLVAIDAAIGRAERTRELWDLPELMRTKGELLRLPGASRDEAAAKNCFRQALDVACRQGALSWELRAASSLARQLTDQGNPGDARELLQPICRRFTEGFDLADLRSAKALLDGFG